ncbi:MAG: bifunctional nuclease family protein [Acidimicrobiales bacterium]
MTSLPATTDDDLVEVTVLGVRQDTDTKSHILVLEDPGCRRLPIFIGAPEAMAIATALQQVATERPLTHDALKQTVDALGARLSRIVIDRKPESTTFTAEVVLAMADGEERHLDWRVSDAVALAVRSIPRPALLVPEALLAAPSAPNADPRRVRVPCPCGASILVDDIDLADDATGGDYLVDADIVCKSCGTRRHVRIEKLPRQVFGTAASGATAMVNEELRSIYLADQKERAGGTLEPAVVARDQTRRQRVRQLLAAGEVRTAEDYFHAAMVFQHGQNLEEYQLAGELASTAAQLGHVGETRWQSARWLIAAAHDRGLRHQDKPQKYGTQFFRVGPDGPLELWEVDATTTDEERAAYNVPSLAEALARAEGRVRRSGTLSGPS